MTNETDYEVLVTGVQRGRIKTAGSRFASENLALDYANRMRKRGLSVRVEEQVGFDVVRVVCDK
jgi:hypothetical protein